MHVYDRGDSKITSGGRPPIADEACVKALHDTVTEQAVNLSSRIQSVKTAVKTVVAQQQSNNPYVDPDSVQISDKTARRIAIQAGVTSVKADVKSEQEERAPTIYATLCPYVVFLKLFLKK